MQNIVPNLWFDDQAGQTAGALMAQEVTLEGFDFVAFNGGPHFETNPSVSFIVDCPTVEGAEALWQGLMEGGKAQQCGWLKDRFGVRWQIVPEQLTELLWETDPATSERMAEALLEMQKIDVGELEVAAEG